MLPQIVLLPPLGHKEAIGTLGYPIASKLGDQLGLEHSSVDKHTHIRLYNIDFLRPNVRFKKDLSQKKFFFRKNTLSHYFRIIVIPSVLLSFLPYYCHSFRIIVIPSVLVSFLPNIAITSKSSRELQILTSSKHFPYPKGEKNGHQRWPYMRVGLK